MFDDFVKVLSIVFILKKSSAISARVSANFRCRNVFGVSDGIGGSGRFASIDFVFGVANVLPPEFLVFEHEVGGLSCCKRS